MNNMPYRIAVTADQHLGYQSGSKMDDKHINLRRRDGWRAFNAISNDIIANKDRIDSVLIPGDIFHTSHPLNGDIRVANTLLRKMVAAGLPIDVFDGNHDSTKNRSEPSAVSILEDTERGIRAHWDPYTIQPLADGVYLHIVPHGGLTIAEAPEIKTVAGAINLYSTHGAAVDPGNHQLMKCLHSPGEQIIPPDVILNEDITARFLGHYHSRAFVGDRSLNTWYTGSTLRRRFSDDPGARGWSLFTIHDDGTVEVEHHDIKQRPQYDLDVINAHDLTLDDVQSLLLTNLESTRERELGAPLDIDRAPIVRQRIINLPHSLRQGLDKKLISQHTAHMSEWVFETSRPEDLRKIGEGEEVNNEEQEASSPSLTSRSGPMNVVKAYEDWAEADSRVLSELIEAQRKIVKDDAEEHLKNAHDLTITDDA